jgi:chaperonin GroEL
MLRNITEVVTGAEVTEGLINGSAITAEAVGTTFGPYGKNVAITKIYNLPHVTKDGVTVAQDIELKDPIQNVAAQVIKTAAKKTADVAGDGTTSTTILTNELVNRSFKYIKNNPDKVFTYKKDLEISANIAMEMVAAKSRDISTYDDMYNVAIVACNGDRKIAKLVCDAFEVIGKEGVVSVVSTRTYDTTLDATEGIKLDRSHIISSLANGKIKTHHENCKVLVTDLDVKSEQDAMSILTLQEMIDSPLLVICNDLINSAAKIIEYNKKERNVPIEFIRAPYIADARKEATEDLAIATGATNISQSTGWTLKDINPTILGNTTSVEISLKETNIIGRLGDPEKIQERVDYYETKIKEDKEGLASNYKKRLALLTSGAAVIYVGGTNEVEIKEKRDRFDDTVRAVRSALEQGIVPGGCTTYSIVANSLKQENPADSILAESLEALMEKLLSNGKIIDITTHLGNVNDLNIVDPTLVVISTIQNAVGAASMIFTTDCVIIKEEE